MTRSTTLHVLLLLTVVLTAAQGRTFPPQPDIPPGRWQQYEGQAVGLLERYIRINTSNPPGNELEAAEFFHHLFDAAGITNKIFMFAPGRADIYAILKGDGALRPIVLLNHMDVVRAEATEWKAPPFSGRVLDRMIYGRGAMDMKDLGALEAIVMLIAAREHSHLKRNLIFLATGDEEVDDLGSEWILRHHPEIVRGAEYLITEGGSNVIYPGGHKVYGVGVAEKAPLWLRVTAHGRGGHGSIPIADSAPDQLARALSKIVNWQPSVRLIPAVRQYFETIASIEPEPLAGEFRNIRLALRDPAFVKSLTENENFGYQIRDTVSLTMLRAGTQTNVIPTTASADLDVRLLPGDDPNKFITELCQVIGNNQITIERTALFRPPNASPADTRLYRIIERVVRSYDPHAIVTPVLNSGYTESQMYRPLGIVCYGFAPVIVPPEIEATEHAPNERVPVAQIRRGVKMLYQIVSQAAEQK